MGEKEPIVERMDTFERKQHYPCTFTCQGILQQSSTDKLTIKYGFSYHMLFLFIAFPHSSKYIGSCHKHAKI